MKKNTLIFVIPLIVIVLFFIVVISKDVLASRGLIHKSAVQNFGVCSDGTILIGYMGEIEVFQEGKRSFSFQPPTSRAYKFYIEDDKVIIGCAAGYTKIYDSNGNFVEDSELSYNQVKSTAREARYETEKGEKYKLVDSLGFKPFEIKCGNETIIRQDMLDYYFNGFPFWILWVVVFINMAVLVFALLGKYVLK